MNSRNHSNYFNKKNGFRKRYNKNQKQNKNIFIENLNNYLSSYIKKANNSNDVYTFEIQFGKSKFDIML